MDMGCYEASVDVLPDCPGDADGNGVVDFNDIVTSLGNWLNVCY